MMSYSMKELLDKYIAEIKKIYGTHLQEVILYGSYARGDFKEDSDIDMESFRMKIDSSHNKLQSIFFFCPERGKRKQDE